MRVGRRFLASLCTSAVYVCVCICQSLSPSITSTLSLTLALTLTTYTYTYTSTSKHTSIYTSPTTHSYSGTKFFVEAVSQGLRLETSGTGVKVSTIQPGDCRSELNVQTTDEEARAEYVPVCVCLSLPPSLSYTLTQSSTLSLTHTHTHTHTHTRTH